MYSYQSYGDTFNFNGNHLSTLVSNPISLEEEYGNQISTSFNFIIQELSHYIKTGNLSQIKILFESYSKDKIDYHWKQDNLDYYSPIHEAVESGFNSVLIYLLSIGFDINELTSVMIII